MRILKPVTVVVPGLILTSYACTMTDTWMDAAGSGFAASTLSNGQNRTTWANFYSAVPKRITAAWNGYTACGWDYETIDILYEPVTTTAMTRTHELNVPDYEYMDSGVYGDTGYAAAAWEN